MLLSKMEIDVSNLKQLDEACNIANEYSCPAIVVPPTIATPALIKRGIMRGKWKIITLVDHPKGKQYRDQKFRGMPSESLQADGYEILLTEGNRNEVHREILWLSDFFTQYFSPITELRLTVGIGLDNRGDDFIKNICEAVSKIPAPSFIRNTHLTKLPSALGSQKALESQMRAITEGHAMRVKLSGNINSKEAYRLDAHRIGATVRQATAIIDSLKEEAAEKALQGNQETNEKLLANLESGTATAPDNG